jgi:hypothetical protein
MLINYLETRKSKVAYKPTGMLEIDEEWNGQSLWFIVYSFSRAVILFEANGLEMTCMQLG